LQLTRHGPGRPRRPIKDPMGGAEIRIAFAPKDKQRGCDGSPTARQDAAGKQQQNVRPGRAREIGAPPSRDRKHSASGDPDGLGRRLRVFHLIGRIRVPNRGNISRCDKSNRSSTEPRLGKYIGILN
jgi:hypothetical protein